jgi:hypothetical protein
MKAFGMDRIYNAIIHEDLEYYDKITDEDIKMLFLNELKIWRFIRSFNNDEVRKMYQNEPIVYNPDKEPVLYEVNSRGFRSPEFQTDTDILTMGCSQSFGFGISKIENTWPSILSKKSKLSYNSIAFHGDSVSAQIKKAYAYFKEFGHPKFVIAIFPDFNRFEFIENKQKLISLTDKYYQSKKTDLSIQVKQWKNLEDVPKISKMPHDIKDVITQENGYYQAMTAILAFEQYCQVAGIEFLWGTWCNSANPIINKVKKIDETCLQGFKDIESYRFKHKNNYEGPELYYNIIVKEDGSTITGEEIKCHQEYEYLDDFYSGLDRYRANPVSPQHVDGHAGVHKHIHWADIFLNLIKDKLNK